MRSQKYGDKKKSQDLAREQGLDIFHMPWPCKHGHQGPWSVATGLCLICGADRTARPEVKEAKAEYDKIRYSLPEVKEAIAIRSALSVG